jgi:hypothetical protein
MDLLSLFVLYVDVRRSRAAFVSLEGGVDDFSSAE